MDDSNPRYTTLGWDQNGTTELIATWPSDPLLAAATLDPSHSNFSSMTSGSSFNRRLGSFGSGTLNRCTWLDLNGYNDGRTKATTSISWDIM